MGSTQIVSGIGGIFAGIFAVFGLLAFVVVLFIILIVANRAEPDPRGLRPFSVYLFGTAFVTLVLTFVGVVMIVTSLLSFIGSHDSPIADGVARSVVIGILFVLIAGGTLAYHLRKGVTIAQGDDGPDGPNARILHTYSMAVTFVFLVVAIITLGFTIYFVFELAGPGIFGSIGGDRTSTLQTLLDTLFIMVASGAVIVAHARFAPSALRLKLPGAPRPDSVTPAGPVS
ncbi:MAG TPA: DUF5671 domain-containing protein [Acidimicrobiales bacterium]|nr:DUF5671 domain-containing protein [Acidimicrobiales bacterium]